MGMHSKFLTIYFNDIQLHFQDREARDEAYADLEIVKYDGCFRDMVTQNGMYNDKALATEAALKKLILEQLPHKILE